RLPGKAEGLAETKPGALADVLGGEEGLEDRSKMFGGDAGSGIADRHGDEWSGSRSLRPQARNALDFTDGDFQSSFAIHGVAGVDRQIDQRGLELGNIGDGEASLMFDSSVDPDTAADQRSDQLRDVFDLRADIEQLRLQRLAPGKSQQLRCKLCGAVDGF